MVRNSFVLMIGFIVILNGCLGAETKFTDLDLDAIESLTKYLGIKCVVFVKDGEDVTLMKNAKTFSGRYIYHVVLNRMSLYGILTDNIQQSNFFSARTAIVTKESLDLTFLLKKVSSPHFLTWIIFNDYTCLPKLSYIPISSQVIFMNSTSERFPPAQIYHLKPEANATVTSFPVNTSTDWVDSKLEKLNFQNLTFNMLVLNQRKACERVNGTLKKLECVHQQILELMGERLNFSIYVDECMEKKYPFTYPNGSDSVLFLKLKNREVDFSAVSLMVRKDGKRNYLEFIWPTFVLKSRMYLRQGKLTGRWLTFLKPLKSSVWWVLLVWIILTGVLIHIFEKLLMNQLKINFSIVLDLVASTLKALQVFCNQAITDLPQSSSLRIVYMLKFFVVLIFFQAYCGYLVSSLTVVVSRFPFKDLDEFFENQQYQIMTLRRGFHQYYFRKVIGEGKNENFMLPPDELPETIQQAVDKLCKQKYLAFGEFREDFLNFNKLECKISELPTPTAYLFVGISMPKKTPLKEFLGRELLHLKSVGLLERLGSRLSSQTDFHLSENDFTTVSMGQIFSVFIFLVMGIVLSIVILIFELILNKCRPSSNDIEDRLKEFSQNFNHTFSTPGTTPRLL